MDDPDISPDGRVRVQLLDDGMMHVLVEAKVDGVHCKVFHQVQPCLTNRPADIAFSDAPAQWQELSTHRRRVSELDGWMRQAAAGVAAVFGEVRVEFTDYIAVNANATFDGLEVILAYPEALRVLTIPWDTLRGGREWVRLWARTASPHFHDLHPRISRADV